MRSLAREAVFKYIYSRLFNPSDEGLFDVLCKDLNNSDKDFAKKLLKAIDDNQDKYLEVISTLSIGYKINRIFNADRCALLLGMAELDSFPETDTPVIIDETVNIVAKFSAENSTDFVNGIIAEYAKERNNG